MTLPTTFRVIASAYVLAGTAVTAKICYNDMRSGTLSKEKNCSVYLGEGTLGTRNVSLICTTAFHNTDTYYRFLLSCEDSLKQCSKCDLADTKAERLHKQSEMLSLYHPFWPKIILNKIFENKNA